MDSDSGRGEDPSIPVTNDPTALMTRSELSWPTEEIPFGMEL